MLAGGQSLGPLLNLRLATPAVIVDVNGVSGLDGVATGDGLRLGALVRQRILEQDERIRTACPLLAEAAPLIGHVAIRNRGTVGGSIAHADPAAELPAVVTALDAEVELVSVRGSRIAKPSELFDMPLTTTIAPDELLVGVLVPEVTPRTGHAWLEVAERHGDFALAGVAVAVSLSEDGTIGWARIACAGVAPVPFDARAAAAQLEGRRPSSSLLDEAAASVGATCDPSSDVHASSAYRRRAIQVLARRTLERALALAQAGDGA